MTLFNLWLVLTFVTYSAACGPTEVKVPDSLTGLARCSSVSSSWVDATHDDVSHAQVDSEACTCSRGLRRGEHPQQDIRWMSQRRPTAWRSEGSIVGRAHGEMLFLLWRGRWKFVFYQNGLNFQFLQKIQVTWNGLFPWSNVSYIRMYLCNNLKYRSSTVTFVLTFIACCYNLLQILCFKWPS